MRIRDVLRRCAPNAASYLFVGRLSAARNRMASESKDGDASTSPGAAALLPPSAEGPDATSALILPLITGEKNERGIPSAVFIDDISAFVTEHSLKIDDLYGELNQLHGKYKLMEQQLEEGRSRAKKKIPELEASLESLTMLEAKQETGEETTSFYNLSDNVYVQAKIKPEGKVAVWLGANLMVEYGYAEARELLQEQLNAANTKVIITTEVNVARVYNHSVKEARKAKMIAAGLLPAAGSEPVAAAGAGK